jgi:hypothetical protein
MEENQDVASESNSALSGLVDTETLLDPGQVQQQYEKVIRKLESDVRQHIRLEQ